MMATRVGGTLYRPKQALSHGYRSIASTHELCAKLRSLLFALRGGVPPPTSVQLRLKWQLFLHTVGCIEINRTRSAEELQRYGEKGREHFLPSPPKQGVAPQDSVGRGGYDGRHGRVP